MAKTIPFNTFTDANPSFPYQSSEARRQLGIPDSPSIHLAITQLAEHLITLSATTNESGVNIRITALCCASYGVLMKQSSESVEFHFKTRLDIPIDQTVLDRAEKAEPIDWLSQTISRLETEGINIPSGTPQQATSYGWKELQ